VDGGVEAPAGLLAGGERTLGHPEEVGAGDERAVPVQARELGVRAEAREQGLEPPELGLGRQEGGGRRGPGVRVEQAVDGRPHGLEDVALHHELLVAVIGGSVTTWTAGVATGAGWA